MLKVAKEKMDMAEACISDAIADYEREIELLRARRDELCRARSRMHLPSPTPSVRKVNIRSWTSAKNYNVELHEKPVDDKCECPDFTYRRNYCKHIREAREQVRRSETRPVF